MTNKDTIKDLIERAGGISAVADLVGCKIRTVVSWIDQGRFPQVPTIVERTIRAEAARRDAAKKALPDPDEPGDADWQLSDVVDGDGTGKRA